MENATEEERKWKMYEEWEQRYRLYITAESQASDLGRTSASRGESLF